MLMHAPVHPPPPIYSRVLRIRHVGARIKAPAGALLAANLPAITKQRPDGLRPAVVAGVVLLFHFPSLAPSDFR